MKLNYRTSGSGTPLIILHGLYGSSDNWISISKELSSNFQVFIVDQRNHGLSPHSQIHSYEAMREDLLEFMDDKKLERAHLLGHSMGGKTAMLFTLQYPHRVSNLIVVDIAPKNYSLNTNYSKHTTDHKNIVDLMAGFSFKGFKTRTEIDSQLSKSIKNRQIRQFILKNLKRKSDKSFDWKLNIKAIQHNLNNILDGIKPNLSEDSNKENLPPTLFIKGEQSNYIMDEDSILIRNIFPQAQITTIANADHWIHSQQPALLTKTVKYFLEQ